MKDRIQFCDKIIDVTTNEKNTIKSNTIQEQFKVFQTEIKNNEAAVKKILQQRKFKKFNTLKYKPKATTHLWLNKNMGYKKNQESFSTLTFKNIRKRTPL